MRYGIIILTALFILFIRAPGEIYASVLYSPKDSVSSGLRESVCLLTDRNLYVVGEKVLFSAVILNSPSRGEYDWSRVLYFELIGADGKQEVQTKHLITDFRANGYLILPENIFTGNYYLKAYTRWMQNFSSSSFAWVQIKVINPFQSGVINTYEANDESGEEKIIPIDKNIFKDRISCKTDKTVYNQHDKVILNLTVPPGVHHLPCQYCITVIRPDAIDTINYGVIGLQIDKRVKNFPLKYIPDIRGLSLTGRVIDKYTGQGISQAHARLSVLDKKADYSSYLTRDNGGFIFALEPYNGTADMYIMVDPIDDRAMEILVDTEYANDNLSFFQRPFSLNEKEKETATEMMINFQIEQSYLEEANDSSGNGDERIREFFYGRSANTVYIDDYIELPNIGEVIFELVPDVSVITRNDIYYLRSRGYITDLEIYKPLIMIDNIPVSDVGAMLKMTPERIERIDVVDRIYAKGDLLFGGMLNLISRKGDMAGIDLPENSYFFSFDGFVQPDTTSFQDMKNQHHHTRIPDVRNCLYWNPAVDILPGETITLDLNTTDKTGYYLIVVRGVTNEGTIVEGRSVFKVAGSPDGETYKY